MKRITASFATSFRRRLLSFYDASRRKLPWREAVDPYRVLVSEFMLQQTRVETVIPYYERWLQRFPHVEALANASVDDVLKQWEGLGYYSRARNLHRAARTVREKYAGTVPSSYDALRGLPGVGEYTAAAVASIAYDRPHAAVDGNVRRVLCRIFDLEQLVQLQERADALIDHQRPGDFNQAMMELGATICTPRSPDCRRCPVLSLCAAHRNGTIHLRPPPKVKAQLPEETVNTLVAMHENHVLVVQREDRGLLAGLWEFPAVSNVRNYPHVGTVSHTFTHKRIHYRVYFTDRRVRLSGSWVAIGALDQLAFSTAQRRVAKLALPDCGS